MTDFDLNLFESPVCPPVACLKQETLDRFLARLKIPSRIMMTSAGCRGNVEVCSLRHEDKMRKLRQQGIVRSVQLDTDNPVEILQEGVQFVSDVTELLPIMHRTMDALQYVTGSHTAILYFVTQTTKEIYQAQRKVVSRHYIANWTIAKGSTIAAYVAFTKLTVVIDDVWVDYRFPLGIGHKDIQVKAAICTPILSPENNVFGVIELTKKKEDGSFSANHVDLVLMITAWFGHIIFQKELCVRKAQQLTTVSSMINLSIKLTEIPQEDMIIYEVLKLCNEKLKAHACWFYYFISGEEKMLTEVFEDDNVLTKQMRRKRLLDITSIAGHVAKTHEVLNIREVAMDGRFNKSDSFMPHIALTSVLCREVVRNNKPVGVLQVNNKAYNGIFVRQDELLLDTIATFLSYLMHMIDMRRLAKQNTLLNQLVKATVAHHLSPCNHCQTGLTSSLQSPVNAMHWQAKAWDWVSELDKTEDINGTSIVLCNMLRNVVTGTSIVKHNLHVLIVAFIEIYHKMSKKKSMAAFYNFQMAFCIIIRNEEKFRLTDKLAVLICALFSEVAIDQKKKKPTLLLENLEYQQLRTLFCCLGVCEKLPDRIRKVLNQELKILLYQLDTTSLSPTMSPRMSEINIEEAMNRYLTETVDAKLTAAKTDELTRQKQNIIQSNKYHLFLRHFHYVIHKIETDPSNLDPFYSLLDEQRDPNWDLEDHLEFAVRFIQSVVLPQFENLVNLFPNCADILQLANNLKVNFERAIAGEPGNDWKIDF